MSSANSSFSSYDGGADEDQNEQWLNGASVIVENDAMSGGSSVKSSIHITFDEKYEFVDHAILGEVLSQYQPIHFFKFTALLITILNIILIIFIGMFVGSQSLLPSKPNLR